MHARWAIFLKQFHYVFNYKLGVQNTVANTLSRQLLLLHTLQIELLGFESLKDQYVDDFDFKYYWDKCTNHEPVKDFQI